MSKKKAKKIGPQDRDGKYWYRYFANAKTDKRLNATLLKNFDQLPTGEPQVRFILARLKKLNASLDVFTERVKSDEQAEYVRDQANDRALNGGDLNENAVIYTRSIAYATPKSRALALGYANRSTVAFKAGRYDDCLDDIERALAIDYPDHLKARLYSRRVRCYATLKKPQALIDRALADTREALLKMDKNASGRGLIEKVLNDPHHLALPHVPIPIPRRNRTRIRDDDCDIRGATGITLKYSEKYGKHIVATRDLKPGEIIAVADVYAKARSPFLRYTECADCIKQTFEGIPCDHCVNVIYCSTDCRDRAWQEYHESECPVLGPLLELEMPTNGILLVRIALKALQEAGGIVELKEMVDKLDSMTDEREVGYTDGIFDCSKYASVHSLTCHMQQRKRCDEYYATVRAIFAVYYLATRSEIFGKKYEGGLDVFDKNPLLDFFVGLIVRNSSVIQTTGASAGDDDDVEHHDSFLSSFIGICNHSCCPNISIVGEWNKSFAFTILPIKAGEQLFNNYMGLYHWKYSKAQRQQQLWQEYKFECECQACVEDWGLLEDLPRIPAFVMDELPEASRPQLLATMTGAKSVAHIQDGGGYKVAESDAIKRIEAAFQYCYPCRDLVTSQDTLVQMILSSNHIWCFF